MVTWLSQNGWEDVCRVFFVPQILYHTMITTSWWAEIMEVNPIWQVFVLAAGGFIHATTITTKKLMFEVPQKRTHTSKMYFLDLFPGDFLRILPCSQPPGSMHRGQSTPRIFGFKSQPVKPRSCLEFFPWGALCFTSATSTSRTSNGSVRVLDFCSAGWWRSVGRSVGEKTAILFRDSQGHPKK